MGITYETAKVAGEVLGYKPEEIMNIFINAESVLGRITIWAIILWIVSTVIISLICAIIVYYTDNSYNKDENAVITFFIALVFVGIISGLLCFIWMDAQTAILLPEYKAICDVVNSIGNGVT